jgi:hypothetical protein
MVQVHALQLVVLISFVMDILDVEEHDVACNTPDDLSVMENQLGTYGKSASLKHKCNFISTLETFK